MKKIALILLLGVVVAFATAPTLVAPASDSVSTFTSPFVGAAFGPLIWTNNQPMDASTYAGVGTAQLDTGTGMDSRLADDFTITSSVEYNGVEFLGGEWNGSNSEFTDWFGMDIEIFADDSGVPANPPGSPLHSVHVDWADITSCTQVYDNGAGVYVAHIVIEYFNPIYLPAGDYWFSIWPYLNRGAGDPQTGMMRTPNDTGSDIYFSSGYFGYPDWVTWDSVVGWGPEDLAFNMYGFYPAVEETTWGQIKAAF